MSSGVIQILESMFLLVDKMQFSDIWYQRLKLIASDKIEKERNHVVAFEATECVFSIVSLLKVTGGIIL